MTRAIVPLQPAAEIDLVDLAPFVHELAASLDPREWSSALAGLVRGAPAGLLVEAKLEARRGHSIAWTLDALVEHVLVQLAWLSLLNGRPVVPEVGTILVTVLADPRLGLDQRWEIETIMIEDEQLDAEPT